MSAHVPASSAEEPRLDLSAARQEDGRVARLSRRGLLASLLSAPVAAVFAWKAAPAAAHVDAIHVRFTKSERVFRHYGYLDVQEAHRRGWQPARVTLDGVDVSDRCYACDDTRGVAWLFKVDSRGQKFLDRERDEVASEVRHGRVVFTPRQGEARA